MIPNFLRRVRKNPLIILGNQKSGTTAIAALLAKRTGLSATIDTPVLWEPTLSALLNKKASLADVINKNRKPFTKKIIKEPNLTFFTDELFPLFPSASYVFIIRDPRDNIRSILNRIKVKGDLKAFEGKEQVPTSWASLFDSHFSDSDHYIEQLAFRWNYCAEQYLKHASSCLLIRYEDFVLDKEGVIDGLCDEFSLQKKCSISSIVDKQFQPKGNQDISWEDFFGVENRSVIDEISGAYLEEFGYR